MSANPSPLPIRTAPATRSVLAVLESFRKQFPATGEHENFLVELMAHARWKLNHFQTLEAALLLDLAKDCPAGANPDLHVIQKLTDNPNKTLTMIQRATAAAERSYFKAHAEYMKCRAEEAAFVKSAAQIINGHQLRNKANLPDLAAQPLSGVTSLTKPLATPLTKPSRD